MLIYNYTYPYNVWNGIPCHENSSAGIRMYFVAIKLIRDTYSIIYVHVNTEINTQRAVVNQFSSWQSAINLIIYVH